MIAFIVSFFFLFFLLSCISPSLFVSAMTYWNKLSNRVYLVFPTLALINYNMILFIINWYYLSISKRVEGLRLLKYKLIYNKANYYKDYADKNEVNMNYASSLYKEGINALNYEDDFVSKRLFSHLHNNLAEHLFKTKQSSYCRYTPEEYVNQGIEILESIKDTCKGSELDIIEGDLIVARKIHKKIINKL